MYLLFAFGILDFRVTCPPTFLAVAEIEYLLEASPVPAAAQSSFFSCHMMSKGRPIAFKWRLQC
jgi:hypothetical protein